MKKNKRTILLIIVLILATFQVSFAQYVEPRKTGFTENQIISQSPISKTYESQGVISFPAAQLLSGEKSGWNIVEDLYSRNVTTLSFQLKQDTTNIQTDTTGKRYFKTRIRFGFTDDEQAYQLPEVYYIQESQYRYFHTSDDEEKMNLKNPCLMFANETFYIFIPDYIGDEKMNAILYTYTFDKGLVKQILWPAPVRHTGLLPYFREDEKNGFALIQSNESNYALYTTTAENGKWITRATEYEQFQPRLENIYKDQVQPFFLPIKPEPFQKVIISDLGYSPIIDLSIFMNTTKDKMTYAQLNNLLPITIDFFKSRMEDHGKFKQFFHDNEINKNRVFYNPMPHHTILTPNMPATKLQDPFGTCESYAYGALYAQWINSDWQLKALRKIESDALKKETDISYFGMQQYLRGNKVQIDSANLWKYNKDIQKDVIAEKGNQLDEFDFEKLKDKYPQWYFPFEIILQNENRLDSIPYFVGKYYFERDGNNTEKQNGKWVGTDDKFRTYLLQLYNNNHNALKTNNHYINETAELHNITGIPLTNIDLHKAFGQPNFQAFLYLLFFTNCTDYITVAYRNSIITENFDDEDQMKKRIVEIIQTGKPIRIGLYDMPNINDSSGHAILICGYKKMTNPNTGRVVDAFKIHNSWGKVWDDQTNGGWFLADNILSVIMPKKISFTAAYKALKEEWIENTPVYERIYKGKYSNSRVKFRSGKYIGASKGIDQTDAQPLMRAIKNEKITFREYSDFIKKYFAKLGYKFISENETKRDILFEGVTVHFHQDFIQLRLIKFDTKEQLENFKAKLDFSKIQGEFEENANSNKEGYHINIRYN